MAFQIWIEGGFGSSGDESCYSYLFFFMLGGMVVEKKKNGEMKLGGR